MDRAREGNGNGHDPASVRHTSWTQAGPNAEPPSPDEVGSQLRGFFERAVEHLRASMQRRPPTRRIPPSGQLLGSETERRYRETLAERVYRGGGRPPARAVDPRLGPDEPMRGRGSSSIAGYRSDLPARSRGGPDPWEREIEAHARSVEGRDRRDDHRELPPEEGWRREYDGWHGLAERDDRDPVEAARLRARRGGHRR